ncbi:hypothetical protein [Mycolicibacterium holsaticum]|uniref:hypothetical protein n=1 Tax=Mycolicibacterium holsaticum TaxID=152142 RepID=UPI000AEF0850|nr:hypothetical protein [Mycolicibacterium holsaticum]
MKETLEDRLERIGAEAEAGEADQTERPLPPHVKVSRPNLARSKVLQVRLNPEEYEAIERIAERRGLPASTVARERLLVMIAEEEQGDDLDVAAKLELVRRELGELVSRLRRPVVGPDGQVYSSPV